LIKALLTAIAAAALVAGSPGAMSVATFLEKSQALEARGSSAWLSPDRRRLQREAQAAFDAWVRQARPPVACPPKGKAFRGDPQRFLAMLRAVPPAERTRISVREAFRREWNARWPCR
jgi:hypothetical protein